jgi:hypothetical protein
MADELVLRGWGNVDVQIGGPGNPWKYLSSCAAMTGPTISRGATEIRRNQDPDKAGGFKISSKFRTAPELITFDLTTKLSKLDFLDGLDCPFGIRARYNRCGTREVPSDYDPIMLGYTTAEIDEYGYEDLVITDPDNEDEIIVTSTISASYEYRIEKETSARTGAAATVGDAPINDLEICGAESCGGYCGDRNDGCTTFYGVTDADTSPYANPLLVVGTKNVIEKTFTWTFYPILPINGNVDGVECAGDRIIVYSNADSVVAYNDNDGDQDEWNLISFTVQAPTANPNAMHARTGREIWLGCENGYIYKSTDGGLTYTAVHEGGLTTENVNAVFAFDEEIVWAVCDNGIILKSEDSGETWAEKTDVSISAANFLVVKVPPDRSQEAYIGTNNGYVIKTKDGGTTWEAESFSGDGVGTIDDLEFAGPDSGEILFILQNDSGPRGRILRDMSGGALGSDVEIAYDYTTLFTTGVELNSIAACGVNEVWAGGENISGYPVVLRVS